MAPCAIDCRTPCAIDCRSCAGRDGARFAGGAGCDVGVARVRAGRDLVVVLVS